MFALPTVNWHNISAVMTTHAYRRSAMAILAVGGLFLPLRSPPHRFVFNEYRKGQGRANLAVTCLLQDSEGFLWVGSKAGLFRYDGQKFQEFRSSDPDDRSIMAIHQSINGNLWIASEHGGLLQRRGDHFEPVVLTETLSFQ